MDGTEVGAKLELAPEQAAWMLELMWSLVKHSGSDDEVAYASDMERQLRQQGVGR